MLRMTTERTWNSFIVTIMNLRENPCVCSLAIEAGWHGLPGTVSHRRPSLKYFAAPESFLAYEVVISTAVRGAWPWDKVLHLEKKSEGTHFLLVEISAPLRSKVQFFSHVLCILTQCLHSSSNESNTLPELQLQSFACKCALACVVQALNMRPNA